MEKYSVCVIHLSIVGKSDDFGTYIKQFSLWDFRIRNPYQGSEMERLFCRENWRVRSPIFDRGCVDFLWHSLMLWKNCDFAAYI